MVGYFSKVAHTIISSGGVPAAHAHSHRRRRGQVVDLTPGDFVHTFGDLPNYRGRGEPESRPQKICLVILRGCRGVFLGHHRNFWISAFLIQSPNLAVRRVWARCPLISLPRGNQTALSGFNRPVIAKSSRIKDMVFEI